MSGIAQKYMPNMENEGEPYYEKHFREASSQDSDYNTTNKSEAPYYEQHYKQFHPEPDNRNFLQKGIEKGGRLATQGAIGAIQRASAPVDIATIFANTLAEKTAPQEFRQNIFSEIERLQDEKARGEWDENSQNQYDSYVDLIQHPEKMEQFLPKEPSHFDTGSLIEKGAKKFGVDLSPQGADEMALRWIGFIKNPKKAQEVLSKGNPLEYIKEMAKALAPSGKEALRGAGAGTALQYAAENEFGPIGTMGAVILGDLGPDLVKSGGKALGHALSHPGQVYQGAKDLLKMGIAKGIAAFTPKDQKGLQQALINDFREAGIQADIGSITGNNLVKWAQTTLAQSGLTGQPLEEFKKSLTANIEKQYKALVQDLGESVYETRGEAGEALKTGLAEARDLDLGIAREHYNTATERAGFNEVFTGNVGEAIQNLEAKLAPGALKSTEQQKVLEVLNKLKSDVLTPEGGIKSASIKSLINNKIALNDIIDYETQGGAKKLLKNIVKELDDAISSHGKVDPKFAKEWKAANEKFSSHAKLFRGKELSSALRTQDPNLLFNRMNSAHGVDQIRKALNVSPEGRQLFDQLAAYKLQDMIGKNLIDSTTKQANFGTFSRLLEKGNNKDVVRAILGKESLQKLEKLSKASGTLAESAQKYLNASRSGYQVTDVAALSTIATSLGMALMGNPWPALSSIGALKASQIAAKVMADPKFLQLVEDFILEGEKGSTQSLIKAGNALGAYGKNLIEPAIGSAEIGR